MMPRSLHIIATVFIALRFFSDNRSESAELEKRKGYQTHSNFIYSFQNFRSSVKFKLLCR